MLAAFRCSVSDYRLHIRIARPRGDAFCCVVVEVEGVYQQPRNQPPPRRTKFGDGTFLAGLGVVLLQVVLGGVVLGVVLKTENALRWGASPGAGAFSGEQPVQPGRTQEPGGGLGPHAVSLIHTNC